MRRWKAILNHCGKKQKLNVNKLLCLAAQLPAMALLMQVRKIT